MNKETRKSLKLLRGAFDEADRSREDDLETSMTRISRAHSESALDECVAEALAKLDVIEEGYRVLNTESNEIAQAFPGAPLFLLQCCCFNVLQED